MPALAIRAFTATGDAHWLDLYWKEINETKSQPKAIATLTGRLVDRLNATATRP